MEIRIFDGFGFNFWDVLGRLDFELLFTDFLGRYLKKEPILA
jgi:hypothetical protein